MVLPFLSNRHKIVPKSVDYMDNAYKSVNEPISIWLSEIKYFKSTDVKTFNSHIRVRLYELSVYNE